MGSASVIIVAVLGSGAFTAVVNLACNLIMKKKETKNGVSAGVMILLDDKIGFLCKEHLREGQISTDDRRRLIQMHEIYHSLGGNGYHTDIMERVKKLPIV